MSSGRARGGLVAGLALAVGLALAPGCGPGPESCPPAGSATLAVPSWPASAAIFVAQEEGLFAAQGIDASLITFDSGHLGVAAVVAGTVDFAVAGETPITGAVMGGAPIVVLATLAEVDEAIVIVARRDLGIQQPSDLAGKRIGVTLGTTADFFLQSYLATRFVAVPPARIVDLSASGVVGALLAGEVDAVSTWDPFSAELQAKLGERALVLTDSELYRMTWNLVARRDYADAHPEMVRKLLRALVQATGIVTGRPERALAVTARHSGAEEGSLRRTWPLFDFRVGLDQSLVVNMEDQARWLAAGGFVRPAGDESILQAIHTAPLRDVAPEAVRIPGS